MEKLLEELFKLYYRDVWRYLYSLCRDATLAEDLSSETFLEAVKAIATFRGRSDIKTWLFSIARHRWYACLRRQGKGAETEDLWEFLEDPGKGPEERLMDREAARRVRELLAREPERVRNVVQLRMEGYSFHEIGRELEISENSARVIHFRAREKLRKALVEEGLL